MVFSRQEYSSGLPCPPLGDPPNPGIKPASLSYISCIGKWVLYPQCHLGWKNESICSKIRSKTRMPTLPTIIQHSFWSPSHVDQRRKRNKRNTDWKRNKTPHTYHPHQMEEEALSETPPLPALWTASSWYKNASWTQRFSAIWLLPFFPGKQPLYPKQSPHH